MRRSLVALGAAGALVIAARKAAALADAPAPRVRVDGCPHPAAGGGAPGLLTRDPRREAAPTAHAHLAPPSWEPRALTRIAGWVPEPPRTPLGRAAAYVWAGPLTVAGLMAGAASLVAPRRVVGVLLFSPARGPAAQFLRVRGFSAMTIGHVVVARIEPSEALLAHELVHVRQAERLGPLMAPLYLALMAVYGYARHPMERAARLAQRRSMRA